MNTFGQIDWNDEVYGDGQKNTNSKDLFLRLDDGSNEMRLVTQPYQYLVHKVKKDPNNPKDFGQKVLCSAIHGSCPVCSAGDKAKPRWLLGVISRKTNTYKILDISFAVFQQIRKLAKNQRWGDPSKYDIDVIVDRAGGATGYYTVQPIGKEPLSAEDQKIKDNVDLEDLKRRVTPPTAEQVEARVAKIVSGGTSPIPTNKAVAPTVAKTTPVDMSDDNDFPEV